MKRFLILILLTIPIQLRAQGTEKLNLELAQLITDRDMQQRQIHLLVQGDIAFIQHYTEGCGGVFRYSVGDIATVRLPLSALANLARSPQVRRMESPMNQYVAMNDSMRSAVRANQVFAGAPPLPQGYKGAGVVVGIIDTGVDLTHPDLLDSAGNTRVKYLWDQRLPNAANTPSYGYGQEWNGAQIDAGQASASNDVQGYGHGTHVTGIAAGDGSANGKNRGVAPETDIIEVAFNFNDITHPTYADAVDFIFSRAQILGKPCVINASLGDYYGSHDGYDLQSQMIKTLLNQQNGRSMVAAAGNAGTIPFHLGYNVSSDTSWTWIRHNPAYQSTYFQLWGDTSDFKFINFSIGADVNNTTASYRGKLNYRTIFYNLGLFKQDTLFSTSGNRLAIIQSFGSIQGPAYLLEFNIIPDSNNYQWRLMTTGAGRFDMWKFYDGTGQPGYVNLNLPSSSIVPEITYYKLPDSLSTIVSGFQCLEEVIAVGNYGNRNFYVDYNGNTQTDPSVTPGQIVTNSSWGPTRDGRIKPDVAAPGSVTLSCGQLSLLAFWQNQPGNVIKIAEGGYHFRDGGTSSASPVVAGIAALFFQQNPNASAMQVRNAIVQCALQDSFTGSNLPNNIWGWGKADALNTLSNCSLTTYHEILTNTPAMQVYPNPVQIGGKITIVMEGNDPLPSGELRLTDSAGRLIYSHQVTNSHIIEIPCVHFREGFYVIHLLENGHISESSKVMITGHRE